MKNILTMSEVRLGQHLQLNTIKAARVLVAVYVAGVVTRKYWQNLNLTKYFTYTTPII
jgi:hypothetical protein